MILLPTQYWLLLIFQGLNEARESVKSIGLEPTIIIMLLIALGVVGVFILKALRDIMRDARSDSLASKNDLLKVLDDRRSDLVAQEKTTAALGAGITSALVSMTQALRDLATEIKLGARKND